MWVWLCNWLAKIFLRSLKRGKYAKNKGPGRLYETKRIQLTCRMRIAGRRVVARTLRTVSWLVPQQGTQGLQNGRNARFPLMLGSWRGKFRGEQRSPSNCRMEKTLSWVFFSAFSRCTYILRNYSGSGRAGGKVQLRSTVSPSTKEPF